MSTQEEAKRAVGRRAAEFVEDGMAVGLGTGSTAKYLVDRLGERVRDGLRIRCVATSERTAEQAAALSIPLTTLEDCHDLDIAIDGADQIDPAGHLIKGLGGALFREKRVAAAAEAFVIIADPSKEVPVLGVGCPVPVEFVPEACDDVEAALRELGADPVLRLQDGQPYVTDNQHWILDAHFGAIGDPFSLEREINQIPLVLENGLFPGMATRILVGDASAVREWAPAGSPGPEGDESSTDLSEDYG
ncbi:MAG: ribose-5-phosphate isomerase A [Gemmatimonadota bacterium]|nr:MAG: ribose-5-phosphate isomerase A [Gemmatimonadota bacterium]